MLYKSMTGLAAALVLCGTVGTANADLIGDTVFCSATDDLTCSAASAIVVNPPEFRLVNDAGASLFNVNLFGGGVRIDVRGNGTVTESVLTLTSLNWTDFPAGVITGFTFSDANGGAIPGFDSGDVTTGPNSVRIDLSGTTAAFTPGQPRPGGVIRFEVDHSVDPIPEPATILLLGSGLAGLGLLRWRKSAKA